MTENQMSIGKVAKKADVRIDTIRYYERFGLIPNAQRTDSGYRKFSQDTVARIQFIKRAKELGFTLHEIEDLLTLRVDPKTKCEDVKKRSDAKIREIKGKIQMLKRMEKALGKISSQCHTGGPKEECAILEALEKPSMSKNGEKG